MFSPCTGEYRDCSILNIDMPLQRSQALDVILTCAELIPIYRLLLLLIEYLNGLFMLA